MQLSEWRNKLEQSKGQKEKVTEQIDSVYLKLRNLNRELQHTEYAQAIFQKVAQQVQQELVYHISNIVSMALASVFDEPYELEVQFVLRRGKTECDMLFFREGESVDPLSASGGGAVDVASFALRIALWSIAPKRSRSVMILDEPFKWLSSDLQDKAGEMVKEVSKKLNIQIIMVSHVHSLIESADKVFNVIVKKGVSEII